MSDFIPEEIVVGVLKRLPVESLIRSRCVCKWWKQLINSPSFILDHLAFQIPQFLVHNGDFGEPSFLLFDPQTLPLADTLPYSFEKKQYGNFALLGTLHGIVCFYDYDTREGGIYVWNPWMRKLLNVPIPEFMHWFRDDDYEHDRDIDSAFWIDPSTKHFKMIVFKMVYSIYDWKKNDKSAIIYSSIEGDWKEIAPSELKCIANY